MELIILSLVGSLGTVLLHLLEFIRPRSGHAPLAATSAQTRNAGAAELQTETPATAFRQRQHNLKRVTASAGHTEDLLADRQSRARSLRAG